MTGTALSLLWCDLDIEHDATMLITRKTPIPEGYCLLIHLRVSSHRIIVEYMFVLYICTAFDMKGLMTTKRTPIEIRYHRFK